MTSYAENSAWKEINSLLPAEAQMADDNLPQESSWSWRGNTVHLERYENRASKCKIILHHGVGTNARQLNLNFGHRMAALGYDVVALDNLGYGMTKVTQKDITYQDWVSLFVDFIEHEKQRDTEQEIILYGLSAGGMLTYHAACQTSVAGIIGTCFLRNDNGYVGEQTSLFPLVTKLSKPLMSIASKTPLKRLPLPMKWVSKMHRVTNNKEALRVFLKDSASSASLVQQQFLNGYLSFPCSIIPEQFEQCPVMLAQPELDKWTPQPLTDLSLKGLKVPLFVRTLQGAGHYPMEQPGLDQLIEYSNEFIQSVCMKTSKPS